MYHNSELLNILDRARALEITDFRALLDEHIAINRGLWEEPDGAAGGAHGVSALPSPDASPYPDNLDAAIRRHVKSVFDKNNHNLTATKTALGISLNSLKKYLAEYGAELLVRQP